MNGNSWPWPLWPRRPEADGGFSWEKTDLVDALKSRTVSKRGIGNAKRQPVGCPFPLWRGGAQRGGGAPTGALAIEING